MKTKENGDDKVEFKLFTNDGEDESLIALTTLKEIFSKQLPKMPKEYIVRLVFDLNHYSLAILKSGNIIGGICYRPYFEQHFAEIAFCAISGTEQVRGYGTILMNNTKHHVQKQGIEYFLTFADNYAIGYFQKQGFTKTIGLSKERWLGWIKEYDGGTLMECYIHPGVNFLRVPEMVAFQRNFLYERIIRESKSHIVYKGLDFGEDSADTKEGGNANNMLLSILEAPGVLEAGWNSQNLKGMSDRDRNVNVTKMNTTLRSIVDKIRSHETSWPFLDPVDETQYPDYYHVIQNPIDLRMISDRLNLQTREGARRGEGNCYYRTKDMLRADLLRMVENCKKFNSDISSEYHQAALKFETFLLNLFGMEDAKGSIKGASELTTMTR